MINFIVILNISLTRLRLVIYLKLLLINQKLIHRIKSRDEILYNILKYKFIYVINDMKHQVVNISNIKLRFKIGISKIVEFNNKYDKPIEYSKLATNLESVKSILKDYLTDKILK